MIVVEGLTKYYGPHAALENVSFRIREGEIIGLLGLNGAGKTTTLRILSGLLAPTSGSVHIAGLDIEENSEAIRSRIGFLPETPPLYIEMTVRRFLTFVAQIKGMKSGVDEAVNEAMRSAELGEVSDEVIGTLSHGYRKRVGIAQAIVHKPALILLDEPTSGLDPVQIVQMRGLIRGLKEKHTVMVSSHILGEIQQLCDRLLVLQNGRLAAQGTEQELGARFASAITAVLEVRGDAAQAQEACRAVAGVTGVKVVRSDASVHVLEVEMGLDEREALAKAVINAGVGLLRLDKKQMELEALFLQLAKDNRVAAEKAA